MKEYTKTHTTDTALLNHIIKIKAAGGKYTVADKTVAYSFPEKPAPKEPSRAEKTAIVKKSGNIITFKRSWPTGNGDRVKQITVIRLALSRSSTSAKIEGRSYDTPWYDSLEDLLKAVNWGITGKNMKEYLLKGLVFKI